MLDLVERFGSPGAEARIDAVSLYKASAGKQYESDYAAILLWDRRSDPDGATWDPAPPDWQINPKWLESKQPKPAPQPVTPTGGTTGTQSNFVICGYTVTNLGSFAEPKRGLNTLILGLPDGDGKFRRCGQLAAGLRKTGLREELSTALTGTEMESSPFGAEEEISFRKEYRRWRGDAYPGQPRVTWVQPRLVVQVKFHKFTRRCRLAGAAFKGLRRDLKPEDLKGLLEKLRGCAV